MIRDFLPETIKSNEGSLLDRTQWLSNFEDLVECNKTRNDDN